MPLLLPSKTKFKKLHKNVITGLAPRGTELQYGCFGLISLSPTLLTAKQLEACRKSIIRKIRHIGRLWIRVFPHYQVTKKPSEVRMGQGKGEVKYWVCRIKQHRIIFEVECESLAVAKRVLRSAQFKLPFATKIIQKL